MVVEPLERQVVVRQVALMVRVLQDILVEQVVTQVHNLIQDQAEVAEEPQLCWLTEMK